MHAYTDAALMAYFLCPTVNKNVATSATWLRRQRESEEDVLWEEK